MKKTWQWVIEYQRRPKSQYDRKMAAECEAYLQAHPEWDSVVNPTENEMPPHQWYWREMIRWTPITEKHCGKHAFGHRDSGMTPKHFAVAQEIMLNLMFKKKLMEGWKEDETLLDPKNYIVRMRNVKTKEIIPGELYSL